ncbi:MAG: branched-chain amino acid ABC transporter permease [Ectothiorhodospiraceae bacterium]|nr:branched-chain amino acid ABC transporter permease [Ectothiorhodospiraceae bacterium]
MGYGLGLVAAAAVLVGAGWVLPEWALFLAIVSLAKGLVVLGLVVLWRTGLVSFGQGLYYGLGAYTVGLLPQITGITDAVLLVATGTAIAGLVAFALGFLLSRYREIFFAMLCLAFAMILYGILVKTEALGSTDGFHVVAVTYLGYAPAIESANQVLYVFTAIVVVVLAGLVGRYLQSVTGQMTTAIRDNELRVEYLGFSVRRAVHTKFVIAGALAGAGGAIVATAIGHVDPEMVWWITSGEFVFVTILSGSGSVIAPFIGSTVFELLRSFALEYAPNFWQIIVGGSLLAVIMFLPGGLWSLVAKWRASGR